MPLRFRLTLILAASLSLGCRVSSGEALTEAESRAIADTLEATVKRAYDFSAPRAGAAERLLSLYPDSGRVVSASGGRMLTSRDSLADGIRYFWESTGRNMQQPRIVWERIVTDVLGSRSAVLTATYRIPHMTPRGQPHELAGAMTMVFAKRGHRWVVVQEHLSDRADSESAHQAPATGGRDSTMPPPSPRP
jgi:ketosteroid isomerase-like protein